ncbi:hypothetical protein BD410DRAFT_783192 [Rickenella mellea]|uniref:F-box domain-containing protein n=1 Tax=Rickenella mellea TaxID=50990 RepID=A0A4Y7QJG9_9AGAM|nr:hypothetical protein BD410DRAFT_783192 [Rickenella mellea]
MFLCLSTDSDSDSVAFEDDSDDDSYREGSPPPQKKMKTKKTTKLSKVTEDEESGRLAVLPSMPLDILCEIFGHLRPIDILQLTRANKAPNKLLMSPSGKSVWNAARESKPAFPETPDDMSDAEWVHLIFETNCHAPGCKKKGVRRIDWALRIRACDPCFKKKYTP